MANQQLVIQITAQDGATGAFKSIGSSAQQMGTQVEKAGGTSVSAMSRLMAVMKQASVGIGLLSASYVKFAQAAVDNERAMRTLDRTYGETADSLRQYADELQRTTTYSSEQAIEAANLFGTLSRNYGLTADQVERLITVSADLAAVNGISLADAAERVQAAIRGEGESAEALGLTMNDAATGLATMSAGMTEAEKAAYRYNALLGQAEFATGAAGDQADTTAGKFTQFVNSLEDAGRGFVEMTGPAGQAVAGLATMSSELGMAIGGFAALAPALKNAASAAKDMNLGMGSIAPAIKAAGSAVKGFAVAMGPMGLVLAAGAALAAIVALTDHSAEYAAAAHKAAEETQGLLSDLEQLALSQIAGSNLESDTMFIVDVLGRMSTAAALTQGDLAKLNAGLTESQNSARDAKEEYITVGQALGQIDDSVEPALAGLQSWNTAIEDGKLTADELQAVMTELYGSFTTAAGGTYAAADALAVANGILKHVHDTGVDTESVISQVAAAFREFEKTGDYEALISTLQTIKTSMDDVGLATRKTSQIVIDLGAKMHDAWWSVMDPLAGVNDQINHIFTSNNSAAYGLQQSINGVTGSVEAYGAAVDAAMQLPESVRDPALANAQAQFYATASAVETLDYELGLAGDNQELINAALERFATRVREADAALTAAEFGKIADDFNAGTLSTLSASGAMETYTAAIMKTGDSADETYAALERIAEAQTRLGGRAANETAQRLIQQFVNGEITAGEFAAGVAALDLELRQSSTAWANAASQWGVAATGAAADLDNLTASTHDWGEAWRTASTGWGTLAGGNIAYWNRPLDDTGTSAEELSQKAYDAATSVGALDTALEQLAAIGAGQRTEGIGHGIRVHIIDVANEATVAINALETGFQALVQNPINWGKQAQDVADWASSLVAGADGVNSLSDLWGRGQIETETYNAGLTAQGRILDANADIQNDVARIQAKQLPIMADLIEGQAKYMDKLADLDPLNQTIALGYMDTTKAAQAQNLVMLAAAAAADTYGSMGTEMATNIITAAAQADPVLKAMLEDLGLISENSDGSIDIKFPRAQSLTADLQRLVESIDALVLALGGIPDHTSATVDVTYRVNGVPALPGQQNFGFTMATGGTVYAASQTPMYATAATGRTTLVGEAGPELLTLPVGSQVASAPVTRDRMRSRTMGAGGGVNFYGPVTLAPASTDVEAAIRREALAGSRGY